jgi:hypothetical protein
MVYSTRGHYSQVLSEWHCPLYAGFLTPSSVSLCNVANSVPGDSEPYCNFMHTQEGDVYTGQMQQPARRRHRRRNHRKGGKGRKPVAAF